MALKPARLQWSDDGALRSLDFGDVYFYAGQGLEESSFVYLTQNNLPERFSEMQGDFRIAELGFGSGLNFLLTAKLFLEKAPPDARLFYAAIEKHPIERKDLERIHGHFDQLPFRRELRDQYPPLIEGFHHLSFGGGRIRLMLLFGDIAETLPGLTGSSDAWYLDGFSPAKNPAMWEAGLFSQIAARTNPGGTLASFSSAGHVRRGLAGAGFDVRKVNGFGSKWAMTTARMPGNPTTAKKTGTVAVLGAGIAGCSAAYALSRRGYAVTLLDRRPGAAQETSGNPAGILYPKLTIDPSPFSLFHSHAFCFARGLIRQLGLPSWRECGVAHIDAALEGTLLDGLERRARILEKNDWPADYTHGIENGIFQPGSGMLSPPEFCSFLERQPGITTRYAAAIGGLKKISGGWAVLGAEGKTLLEAETVVIALNHGSRAFAETEWLPLQALRGQTTALRATPASAGLDRVLCYGGYLTPAIDGVHQVGATFQREEPGAAENMVRAEDDLENLRALNQAFPDFGFTPDHIAGSRSGYRITTPDKLPVIGPCPDYESCRDAFAGLRSGKIIVTEEVPRFEGLYISTGFGAHGLTGAPLAGEIIAALIAGDTLPVPAGLMEYLLPERYIFRGLRRQKI